MHAPQLGVVVRTYRRDLVDRLGGSGSGPNEAEPFARRRREPEVRKEQVLEEVAGEDACLRVIGVEEVFPLGDLRVRVRARRQRRWRSTGPRPDPIGEPCGFFVGERRKAERHAVLGLRAPHGFELCERAWTDVLRRSVVGGPHGIFATLLHDAIEQRSVEIRLRSVPALEHREEVEPRPPFAGRLRILKHARGRDREGALGLIDDGLARPPVNTVERLQVQLTGGIEACVAHDAAPLEQRLNFRGVRCVRRWGTEHTVDRRCRCRLPKLLIYEDCEDREDRR